MERPLLDGAWRSLVARSHGVREVRSSNLLAPTIMEYLGVAQLVAHALWEREVAGSSPVTQTKQYNIYSSLLAGFLFSL